MSLEDALRETGCAIFINGDCTTSVQRLSDEQFLLMTHRGVCILQCLFVKREDLEKRYDNQVWHSAQVRFLYDIPSRRLR